jgi:hypothetical protein
MLLKMSSLELDGHLICRIGEQGNSVGLALDLLFPNGATFRHMPPLGLNLGFIWTAKALFVCS